MKTIIGIIVLTMITSCGTSQKTNTKTPIVKIERTPCLGQCPVYTLELYSNKTIAYNGVKNVNRKGKETLTLSSKAYNTLIQQLEALPFSEYTTEYGRKIRDITFIYVTYNGKKVRMTQGKGPEPLQQLISDIEQQFDLLK